MGVDLSVKVQKETVDLSDGTTLALSRAPGQSDSEWEELKVWLKDHPEEARRTDLYTRDAAAMRNNFQSQALNDYYQAKMNSWDEGFYKKIAAMESNPDFAHIFDEIKRNGTQGAMPYYNNEPLMMKMSRAMGGVPEDVRGELKRVSDAPYTFQEACKMGKLSAVEGHLKANPTEMNSKDARGCTGLAYAIGSNRTAVIKALLGAGASVADVDNSSSTALHYAAAYGRKELAEFFLTAGCAVNGQNSAGLTPFALAKKNGQTAVVDFLKTKGAQ